MEDLYQVVEITPEERYLLSNEEMLPEGQTVFKGTLDECLNRYPNQKLKSLFEYNFGFGGKLDLFDSSQVRPKTLIGPDEYSQNSIETGGEISGQQVYG